MPINTEIQNKVLKIASNKAVDEVTKLAVRKQFYVLKNEEIDFEIKVAEFNGALDKLISQTKNIIPVEPEIVDKPEEVVISKKPTVSGIKVRMQEDVEQIGDEATGEVPFEVDETN